MPQIKVSVGMPVHNAEHFVAQAIEAVLSQSLPDFELIISDNASTDSSYNICAEFARRDPRIRLVRQQRNLGASANYYEVARLATAPLFKWASANDLVAHDFLRACVHVMDERPDCVLCYPATRIFTKSIADGVDFDDNLDLQMDDPVDRFIALLSRLTLSNVLNGIIRRPMLERAGYMPDFANSDGLVLAELSLAGKFVPVPEVMFYRRMDSLSATQLQSPEQLHRDYDPTSGFRMYGRAWRKYAGLVAAIRRAKLTPSQQRRAFHQVAKMAYWNRRALFDDITEVIASLFRFRPKRSTTSP